MAVDMLKQFIRNMDGINKAAVADAAAKAMAEHCDARILAMSAVLRIALDDYEGTNGKVNAKRLPRHWTVKARQLLGLPRSTKGKP